MILQQRDAFDVREHRLGVEQDGEMLVLVFDPARYGELHAASFAASECR